ncbi:protein EXECUTER 1, chloroplastic-like [Zingiber officinale]|uniref:protein EXECUTER 1, chloroplastic-like n=1 Tax=Zingiber officinale TaxID=94328 RepID=UPI001C4D6187|nr:protein EXECUTER 1, chloroplastic-like [Zingiber officinale]XP_042406852.1 protein EXECUTER 1, chloroplastic-like [Zingiber officinale]
MASIPSARLPPASSAGHIGSDSTRFPRKIPVYLPQPPLLPLPRLKRVGTSRAPPSPFLCCCHDGPSSGGQEEGSSSKDGSSPISWDSLIHEIVRGAAKRWDELVASCRNSWSKNGLPVVASEAGKEVLGEEEENEEDGGEWDWERWKRHFAEIEEYEKLVSILKSQLNEAILREDYEDAAKLKLAMSGAAKKDVVGTALTIMNRAIEEERYNDAAFIRDHAGAELVGWWAGISEDGTDPYGRLICIMAEYGRYVARSYSPRQLASGRAGLPLFEIFFTKTDGDYRQQVVYLQKLENSEDSTNNSVKKPGSNSLNLYDGPKGEKSENSLQAQDLKTVEGKDGDINMMDGISIIQNVLRDLIPGSKVRVIKLGSPGKVGKDIISKVVEQIMEEEDDGDEEDSCNEELESIESDGLNAENDIEEVEMEARDLASSQEEKSELSLKVIIGDLTPKSFADVPPTNLVRVPAKLEKRDNSSFSITLGQDAVKNRNERKKHASKRKTFAAKNADLLSFELAKMIPDKDRKHLKVLKDLQELINYSVNNRQNYHSLYETTLFRQIKMPSTSDPLSGLYIGSHGMYSSSVLHLKRKFGQWQEDSTSHKYADLKFYEYVEATKLTGDPSVPAGQVAFRAKLGKQNQLPHQGIIPEEFGVIARYKGQGRLANPGFRNPRWVDGELVIFDGKYIRGGPVIGFVYWAPESHFFLFFNRLSLPA